jgi:photosystem II stability/assembly factor-like uncharacterized protein
VHGTILATADGGSIWHAQSSGINTAITGVAAVNDTSVWAVGDAGTIIHSTDGGTTWQRQSSPTRADMHAVSFVGPSTGWAVGNDGTILATADGGASWRLRGGAVRDDLLALYFVDSGHGWAVGTTGAVIATTDGGATWSRRDSTSQFDLHGVRFADTMRGWAVGVHGTLLITDDGGLTWHAHNTGTSAPFLGLVAAGTRRYWAPTGDGAVLTIAVPDTSAILAAEHLPAMRTALRSVDVSDATIFQRLTDFATADADLTERSNQAQRRSLAAADQVPSQIMLAGNADLIRDLAFQTAVMRIGITIFVLAAAAILGAIARRGMRLSTHIDSFADALVLSGGSADAGFTELARTLSPSGTVSHDLVAAAQPGSEWRQTLQHSRGVREVAADLISGTKRLFGVRL